MISYLKGKIIYFDIKSVIVDVCGVGYKVFTNTSLLPNLDQTKDFEFFTYLAVRENSLDLYGFQNKKELDFFELLLSVSGIGPKSAMTILSVCSLSILLQAIRLNDSNQLVKNSGIGKKNAEKIVLELSGKIDRFDDGVSESINTNEDAMDALLSLGYSEKQIREVLKNIDSNDTKDIIKLALKKLGGRK
jgi:Holliday junction DNA helicase RuvA